MVEERMPGVAPEPVCTGCASEGCVGCVGVETPLAGGRMVAASVGYFLGPLVLAIFGAARCGPSQSGQLLGGVAGLIAGMGIAALVARWFPSSEQPVSRPPVAT